MAKKHREEFKEQIIKMAKEGVILTHIALELKINRLDVKIVLKENNLYEPPRRSQKDNAETMNKAVSMYLEGYALREVEKELDIPRKILAKELKERGHNLRKAANYNRKYSVDDNVFSEYTPESAYWAGFIAGDGCVYSHGFGEGDNRNNYLNVTLQGIDLDHLMKLKKFLKYDGVIYTKKSDGAVSLVVNSLDIVEDLKEKYNISNRKTYDYVPPENIPKDMLKYFILGLIDADGSFLRHKRNNKTSNRKRGEYVYQIGFTGTYPTCELVKDFFGSGVNIHTRHKNRENNNYTVLFQGNEQVARYGDMLYDEHSVHFCMTRKFDNYIALKEDYSEVACIGNDTWKQLVNL